MMVAVGYRPQRSYASVGGVKFKELLKKIMDLPRVLHTKKHAPVLFLRTSQTQPHLVASLK